MKRIVRVVMALGLCAVLVAVTGGCGACVSCQVPCAKPCQTYRGPCYARGTGKTYRPWVTPSINAKYLPTKNAHPVSRVTSPCGCSRSRCSSCATGQTVTQATQAPWTAPCYGSTPSTTY